VLEHHPTVEFEVFDIAQARPAFERVGSLSSRALRSKLNFQAVSGQRTNEKARRGDDDG
jgi:hypothetical protein